MAHELKMPVQECMRRVPYREYLAWQAWFRKEWNNPSRADWYTMQLTAEVRRGHVNRPEDVETRKMRLEFVDQPSQREQQGIDAETQSERRKKHRDTVTALAKSVWLARMTAPVRHVTVNAPPNGD